MKMKIKRQVQKECTEKIFEKQYQNLYKEKSS